MQFALFALYISEHLKNYPLGIWIEDAPMALIENNKRGYNLLFNGYHYSKEACFKTITDWVCLLNSDKQWKCRARCVTRINNNCIKLGNHKHNHPSQLKLKCEKW